MRTCDLHLHFSIYIGKLRKQTCIYFSPMKIRIANILCDNISISKTSFEWKPFLLVSFLPFHSLFFLNLKPPVHFSLLRYLLKMKIDIFIYISLYKNLHISSQNILNVYIIRFYNTHRGILKCKKKIEPQYFQICHC